jgi:predicted CoA-substrate-specific enzyme activase
MSVDKNGRVIEFAMNDRCAAGTGRFFEAMARVLNCGLDGISLLEHQGSNPASITSQCSVFAESEVVTLISEGIALPDIIAGINNSVANRLFSMVRRIGLTKELALTGGCSKNEGLAKALEKKLGVSVTLLPQDPQVAGAVGAALIAREKAEQN